jgi:hypothetical protein
MEEGQQQRQAQTGSSPVHRGQENQQRKELAEEEPAKEVGKQLSQGWEKEMRKCALKAKSSRASTRPGA